MLVIVLIAILLLSFAIGIALYIQKRRLSSRLTEVENKYQGLKGELSKQKMHEIINKNQPKNSKPAPQPLFISFNPNEDKETLRQKLEVKIQYMIANTEAHSPQPLNQKSNEKYQTSSLSHQQKDAYMKTLLDHMETEKPYLEGELGLADLAVELSMPSHHLSELLNETLEQNFYDFVNLYRIEELKKKMVDPKESYKKMLALAYESGFNSKTAFNRAFKKSTGFTPSEYRKDKIK